MPRMPSVPLVSASPSFSASSSGLRARAARAPRRRAGAVADRTSPSPSSASAAWASGARSPLAPSEPCSGTTGTMPALSSVDDRLGDDRAGPARAEREGPGPEEHHRPHDLVLDRGAHPGGVRPDQRDLQRGAPSGAIDVVASAPNPVEIPYGGAPSARRRRSPGVGHPLVGAVGQLDRLVPPPDRDDVGDRDAGAVEVDGHDGDPPAPTSRRDRDDRVGQRRSGALEAVAGQTGRRGREPRGRRRPRSRRRSARSAP